MKCRVHDCKEDARTQGLCQLDYMKARRDGDYTVKPDCNEALRAYSNHPNINASIRMLAGITGLSRYGVAQAVRFK